MSHAGPEPKGTRLTTPYVPMGRFVSLFGIRRYYCPIKMGGFGLGFEFWPIRSIGKDEKFVKQWAFSVRLGAWDHAWSPKGPYNWTKPVK